MDGIWARCLTGAGDAGNDIGFRSRACLPCDLGELPPALSGLGIIAQYGGWRNCNLVERDLVGRRSGLILHFLAYMPDHRSSNESFCNMEQTASSTARTPWQSLQSGLTNSAAGLAGTDIEQILWGNAARLFHLETVAKGVGHDQG